MSTIRTRKTKAVAPSPAVTSTPLSTIAERLDDTAVLLHGLHCRHKNQHRVSTYWWPSFGQLRRAVQRLLADMRHSDAHPNDGAHQALAARVAETRALVPRVYLAFSRLVADKQFAPLGLILVGVLAQVQAAIKALEAHMGMANTGDVDVDDVDGCTPTPTSSKSSAHSRSDVDFGVAIARDADTSGAGVKSAKSAKSAPAGRPKTKKRARTDDSDEDVPKLAAPPTATPAAVTTTPVQRAEPKTHPEKKRKVVGDNRAVKDDDGIAETRTVVVEEPANDAAREKQERRERKAAKETEKEKKNKKKDKKDKDKKRKRGDEFDDLFSGLL